MKQLLTRRSGHQGVHLLSPCRPTRDTVQTLAYKQDHAQRKVHQVSLSSAQLLHAWQLTQLASCTCFAALQEPNRVLKASLDKILNTYYGVVLRQI